MAKLDDKNLNLPKIRNRNFDPEKCNMVVCPTCNSNGYIENPKRQRCPRCGGFGFIKGVEEGKQDTNTSTTCSQ